ncbi:MAG: hypothetical protein M1838_002713 [Thelocarpon superellum]|nr:MAG: hypothetical protein M1838_002713 [Thelocarpon superellum]
MPTKRWIDRKAATTFALVHREQNDPKIHDPDASSMVFQEVGAPNQKVKSKADLEEELGLDTSHVRPNEGEAALHGVFYDDTTYDYMQHMRDLGTTTEGYFVDSLQPGRNSKQARGQGKQRLEDALRAASIAEDEEAMIKPSVPVPLLDADVLPSTALKHGSYQDQQDIPDALAGFQPDMDPRLREVLEALEDEAYVDDEEELFGELARDGVEVSLEEFEIAGLDQDVDEGDEGWATDDTAKPERESRGGSVKTDTRMQEASSPADWMSTFKQFKSEKNARLPPSSLTTGYSSLNGGRRKKRKGSQASSTGLSMSSSALTRTEGLRLLDDRFEKIEEEYTADADEDMDEDTGSVAASTMSTSQFSATSSTSYSSLAHSRGGPAPHSGAIRGDFDALMDDFLDHYTVKGGGKGKKKHSAKTRLMRGAPQTGMEQLEQIRRDLGPAIVFPSVGGKSTSASASAPASAPASSATAAASMS